MSEVSGRVLSSDKEVLTILLSRDDEDDQKMDYFSLDGSYERGKIH